jgi:hypothetical protein
MMKTPPLIPLIIACTALVSCRTEYNPRPTPGQQEKIASEGTVVFVRPDVYTILGTRSIRDYIEVTYEKSTRNQAGFLTAEVGLRNRGGQHFWDLHGPNFSVSVKTTFYRDPIDGKGPSGPPVYETNWQPVPISRGDTAHFKAVCPVPEGSYYQCTISEQLARQ